MRERTRLENSIQEIRSIEKDVSDHAELIEMAEAEGDESIISESHKALSTLQSRTARLQFLALLSGEADTNDAFLQINAGAGGTEAQDWAAMLMRMYMRWADSHGFKVSILEKSDGEEAGIKSVTLKLEGDYAYGRAKTETGVHRLVRISPFDSSNRRHTSFASVGVSPVIDDTIDITIEDKDLRIDTYRSSGAGGQHVNTTDSAVRITHQPTGIVVACQSERSQHQNKAFAMDMLRARLYERELKMREDAASAEHGEKSDIGWGHQIRSYVLHPYQMVKDLRTEVETTNTQAVLDGGLDEFIEAALAQRLDQDTGPKLSVNRP